MVAKPGLKRLASGPVPWLPTTFPLTYLLVSSYLHCSQLLNKSQMERGFAADWNNQGVKQTIDEQSEVYTVKPAIWESGGMGGMSMCQLC